MDLPFFLVNNILLFFCATYKQMCPCKDYKRIWGEGDNQNSVLRYTDKKNDIFKGKLKVTLSLVL